MKRFKFVAVCGAMALPMMAASLSNSDWKTDFATHLSASKAFTLEVAEAMPADGYSYIPPSTVEPVEMTFGQQMMHIAIAQSNAFARVSGMKAPTPSGGLDPKKPESLTKDAVVKFMTDALSFCDTALGSMNDDQLDKLYAYGKAQIPGRDLLWAMFTHTAHHRGSADVYLRLKNVKPPAYRF